jgi:hypothetical protein
LKRVEAGCSDYGVNSLFKEEDDKKACLEFIKEGVKTGEKLSVLLEETDKLINKCVELAKEFGLPFYLWGVKYDPHQGGWTSSNC